VQGYVDPYNNVRLNSAIAYIAPKDIGSRRSTRSATLEAAQKQRQIRRRQTA
jgi:hypothetical protein